MAGVASATFWRACARAVRAARERPRETEVTMSAQQLALELDDARTSTIAVWDELPAETRTADRDGAGRAWWRGCWRPSAMSEHAKITPQHRQRRAVVYVRQSTPGQVERNTESSARQYALAERAVELGWPHESVVVVDEDTGRSAAWARSRIGFRELVAEVGLGHVGVILALEVSRLARSSADWHQLLGSVRAHGHADLRRRRDLLARRVQRPAAARAEGHDERGRVAPDPLAPAGRDREQGAPRRAAPEPPDRARPRPRRPHRAHRRRAGPRRDRARLRALAALRVRAPGRLRAPRRPAAAAAADRRRAARALGAGQLRRGPRPAHQPGLRRRVRLRPHPPAQDRGCRRPDPHAHASCCRSAQWRVCLPDHHPGYVSWPDYLATQDRLRANARGRGEGGGAAREGTALLQGLVRCGRCGRRMMVAYSGTTRPRRPLPMLAHLPAAGHAPAVPRHRRAPRRPRRRRRRFSTPSRPPASTPPRTRSRRSQAAHDERMRLQRLAVERAAYEAERARRQYDACEPEHRLVARTLEHPSKPHSPHSTPATRAARARAPTPRAAERPRTGRPQAPRRRPPARLGRADYQRPRPQTAAALPARRRRAHRRPRTTASRASSSSGTAAPTPNSPSRSTAHPPNAPTRRRTSLR